MYSLCNNCSNITGIEIKGMKPLLFAKQVLSMFAVHVQIKYNKTR